MRRPSGCFRGAAIAAAAHDRFTWYRFLSLWRGRGTRRLVPYVRASKAGELLGCRVAPDPLFSTREAGRRFVEAALGPRRKASVPVPSRYDSSPKRLPMNWTRDLLRFERDTDNLVVRPCRRHRRLLTSCTLLVWLIPLPVSVPTWGCQRRNPRKRGPNPDRRRRTHARLAVIPLATPFLVFGHPAGSCNF
jgi:hypothetical protein